MSPKHLFKRLVFSAARGAFYAAGIGFFLFVRLGLPKDAHTAGYISGLLIIAGVKFGLILGVVGYVVEKICRNARNYSKQAISGLASYSPEDRSKSSIPSMPVRRCPASRATRALIWSRLRGSTVGQLRTPEEQAPPDESTPQHAGVRNNPDSGCVSQTRLSCHSQGFRVPVTVVMPVLNEAPRLAEALEPLNWADEVIVVDGGSHDQTVEVARKIGATVLQIPGSTIAAQRNAGISAARNPWVFALDVDERISGALINEIHSTVQASKYSVFRLRFRNFYLGREMKHGCWGRDWHVRLFRRELRFVEKLVHEGVDYAGDAGQLSACLEHTPYRDLSHHLEKMIRYASWGARDLHAIGRRARFTGVTFVPAWRFLREYLLFSGWRDGERGLVSAALSACAALLKYAHLYAIKWNVGRTTALARFPAKTTQKAPLC